MSRSLTLPGAIFQSVASPLAITRGEDTYTIHPFFGYIVADSEDGTPTVVAECPENPEDIIARVGILPGMELSFRRGTFTAYPISPRKGNDGQVSPSDPSFWATCTWVMTTNVEMFGTVVEDAFWGFVGTRPSQSTDLKYRSFDVRPTRFGSTSGPAGLALRVMQMACPHILGFVSQEELGENGSISMSVDGIQDVVQRLSSIQVLSTLTLDARRLDTSLDTQTRIPLRLTAGGQVVNVRDRQLQGAGANAQVGGVDPVDAALKALT